MLVCLRYLSCCLCVSICLILLTNFVGLFRHLAIILNVRMFSSAVDNVGLITIHSIYLLFVHFIILLVWFAISLQSVLFSI